MAWVLNESELRDHASKIVRNSNVRSFPDEYIPSAERDMIEIPEGLQVTMFRQDENIVVSVDSQRIYLRTNEDAKYIFYSAKRGHKAIPNPKDLDLRNIIAEFESDLDVTQKMINDVSAKWTDLDRGKLSRECSNLLGYHDIF